MTAWLQFTPEEWAAHVAREVAMSTPEQVTIDRLELDVLLAVATLYVGPLDENRTMTLPDKLALQDDAEAVLEKYGRRYDAPH